MQVKPTVNMSVKVLNPHPAQPRQSQWSALGSASAAGPEPDRAEREDETLLSNLTFSGENAPSLPHLFTDSLGGFTAL